MPEWSVDHLTERLQLAALDPSLWPATLDEISKTVGALGAVVFNSASRFDRPQSSAALTQTADIYLREGWNTRDERYRSIPTLLRHGIAVDSDFTTPEERRRSAYYQDFIGKNQMGSCAILGFKAGDELWSLLIQLRIKQEPFDQKQLSELLTLWRPLSDAATLSRQLGFARLLGVSDAFELTNQPAVMLDVQNKVLTMNSLAQRMVGTFFDVRSRNLVFRDRPSQASFGALVSRLCRNVGPTGPCPAATTVINQFGLQVTIRAIALQGGARYSFTGAKVLLLIGANPPDANDAIGILKAAYSLTSTEARFAVELMSGRSVPAIAERSEITYETARTYLRSIFSKTGTHRQGELVALLASVLR